MPDLPADQPREITEAQLQRVADAGSALFELLTGEPGQDMAAKRFQAAVELAAAAAEVEHTASIAAVDAGISFSRLGELAGVSKPTMYSRVYPKPSKKAERREKGMSRGL